MFTTSLRRFRRAVEVPARGVVFLSVSVASLVCLLSVVCMVCALALGTTAGIVRAQSGLVLRVVPEGGRSVLVTLEGLPGQVSSPREHAALHWRWHFDRVAGTSGVQEAGSWSRHDDAGPLNLSRPAGAVLLEVALERDLARGSSRQVWSHSFLPEERGAEIALLPVERTRSWPAWAKAPGDSTLLRGRIVFADRLFDAQGYTGLAQLLELRHAEVEWRDAADGTALAVTMTDSAGHFELLAEAPPAAGVLWLRTRAVDPMAGPVAVVDALGSTHEIALGNFEAGPGEIVDLGLVTVADTGASSLAGAVHLLDLALDARSFLAGPDGPPGWAAAAGEVPLRWDPAFPNATTFFDGEIVLVASPASGSSDAWSDGAVLAALGPALLSTAGWPTPFDWDWLDLDRPAPRAFSRALSWAFAGAVQVWRAQQRVGAQGETLIGSPTLLVDLPSPPPLGFTVSLEAGLELEDAVTFPGARAVVARGQRGAPALAALLWDLLDGPLTPDGEPGSDDDPIDGEFSRWFAAMATVVAASAVPVYEQLHDAWSALGSEQEADAATELAVERAGCALEVDTFEPDDSPETASLAAVWVQPPLAGSGVRVNEIFLGDRDGVELVNRGIVAVDVGGWTLDARRNGFGTGPSRRVTLPQPTLILPGRHLLVLEGTGMSARSVLDAPAPEWVVPWAPDEDGAIILRDAEGSAVDFVRWDGAGGLDRSLEPIPAGTWFTGRLIAPVDGRQSLARDAISTDTDAAANFNLASPTPGWPNVAAARIHTLRPIGDVDHLEIAGTGRVEVHARRDRDDGAPRWSLVEGAAGSVAELESAMGAEGRGALAALWPVGPDTLTVLRLDTDAQPATSTALRVFAWRPASDFGTWPVRALRAEALGFGVDFDSVRVSWSPRGRTDSFRVRLGGAVVRRLAGTDSSVVLALPQGTHRIGVEAFLADRTGAERETGIFIGPIPCGLQTGFEPGDRTVVGTADGFTSSEGPAFEGEFALRDSPFGLDYPVNSEATATLSLPIDLTPGARVSFAHAAHLVPDGDLARLELTTDEGQSWIELARWDGSVHPAGPEDPADWGDGVLTAEDWVEESFDLSAFAGERVRLRWRRTSNASGTSVGWSIDALAIELDGEPGEFWVGASGSDVIGCGTEGRPWASVDRALALVVPGERIVIGPGRYDRTSAVPGAPVPVAIPLPAGVQLEGVGPQSSVIVAPAGGWGVWSAGVSADSSVAMLRNLRIEGGSVGLRLEQVRAELDSIDVVDADTSVVLLNAPAQARASVFAHCDVGLRTHGSALLLERCTVADVGVGVSLEAAGDSVQIHSSLLGRASIAIIQAGEGGASASFECSGLFASEAFFEGPLTVFDLGIANLDPVHCDPQERVYTLAFSSPYLAFAECGLVGARGLGCSAPGVTAAPRSVSGVRLLAPVPNPFNPQVTLAWEQPRPGPTRLEVFDLRGRRVRVLFDAEALAGRGAVVWGGDDARGKAVGSGVYLVRLSAPGGSSVQRIALVR